MKKPLIFFISIAAIIIAGFTMLMFGTPWGLTKAKSDFEVYLEEKYDQTFVVKWPSYDSPSKTYTANAHPESNDKLLFSISKSSKDTQPADDYVENANIYYATERVKQAVLTYFEDVDITVGYSNYPYYQLAIKSKKKANEEKASEATYALLSEIAFKHASFDTVNVEFSNIKLKIEQPFDIDSADEVAALWEK